MKYVVDLGGSIVCPPAGIDKDYVVKFCKLIRQEVKKGHRFVIIVGGGSTSRKYLDVCGPASDKTKDEIGIAATKLNARFLFSYLEDIAEKELFDSRYKFKSLGKKIILGGGWKPGNSTDYVAFQIAADLGIKKVIVLSNIPYIFSDNPSTNPEAKRLEYLKWSDYVKMMPTKWVPRLSLPLDQKAARLGLKEKMECNFAQGQDLKNFVKILRNKKFKGTTIYDG